VGIAAIGGALWLQAASATAQLEHADPLLIPTGPSLRPEDAPGAGGARRLESAARALGDRGYHELPYVAWALVESARRAGDASLAQRAVELAPESPVVWLEAARVARRPELVLRGLASLPRSFPALLWNTVAGGAGLGGAILLVAAFLQALAALRGLPLAGHVLAHVARAHDPPAWPGVLACLCALALAAAFGAGPLALLALAGCAGALFLRAGEAAGAGIALAAAGLVLGPGLDVWSRAAASLESEGVLGPAWRVERGYALPGDEELLERALERRPADTLVQLALAQARVRAGDVERALALLADVGTSEAPELAAVRKSLHGALELARGEVGKAVTLLEQARGARASAQVLFNLSQAYGRALRLNDQEPTYNAARALDADAIARFGLDTKGNLHRFLMPVRVPASHYLRRALGPTPGAARLARELRARLLGRALPDPAWMGLPLLGLACAGLRRSSVARCDRCERTLCAHCSPESLNQTRCVRCVRLFESRQNVDARVRQEQLQLDRRRQRRLALCAAGAALLAPGVGALRRGRWLAGAIQLFGLALGAALLLSVRWFAAPWEVGPLAAWLSAAGPVLVGLAYLSALLQALRLVRGREARA
jgi:hypothetical protein